MSGRREIKLVENLSDNIFMMFLCFPKSFLNGNPNSDFISTTNQNYSTNLKNVLGYLERYQSHGIQ